VVRSGEPTRPDPESFLRAASREELEGVPGLPPKIARDVHTFLRRPTP